MSEIVKTIVDTTTGDVQIVPLGEADFERIRLIEESDAQRQQAEAAHIAAKESARAKLAALGLTDEEIAALVG